MRELNQADPLDVLATMSCCAGARWTSTLGSVSAAGVAMLSLVAALGYGVVSANQRVAAIAAKERETQAERERAEAERATAEAERERAEASYAEARRMGAVQQLRDLEREAREDRWWTRLDRKTGTLKDEPTVGRLREARAEIDRWEAQTTARVGQREAFASAHLGRSGTRTCTARIATRCLRQ